MPKISLPYYGTSSIEGQLLDHQSETELSEYPEGSTLGNYYTTSIHNTRSLNPTTITDHNSGLMSTANGNLDTLNLDTRTTIKAQHIMPEQACLARMESMRSTNTVYGNSSGTLDKHYESGADSASGTLRAYNDTEQFFNLPGLSLRWYQPYDASAALLQWSFFVSFNSWIGRYKDAMGKKFKNGVYTTIRLRCVLDGEPLYHTERVLGENFFHPVSPGANNAWSDSGDAGTLWGPGFDEYDEYGFYSERLSGGNPRYVSPEAHSALHFDLHHLIGTGTDASGKYVSTATLAKGYHEIGVQCSIDAMQTKYGEMSGPVFLQNVGKATAVDDSDSYEFKGRAHFNLTGKLSLGIRNARVMSFL
jgi:hypothetical protein